MSFPDLENIINNNNNKEHNKVHLVNTGKSRVAKTWLTHLHNQNILMERACRGEKRGQEQTITLDWKQIICSTLTRLTLTRLKKKETQKPLRGDLRSNKL